MNEPAWRENDRNSEWYDALMALATMLGLCFYTLKRIPLRIMTTRPTRSRAMPLLTLFAFVAFAVAVALSNARHERIVRPAQTNLCPTPRDRGDSSSLSAQLGRKIGQGVQLILEP